MLHINNSNKMFFLFTLFFSTMIAISANSWLGCWIGLEINLLSFIPLMSSPQNLLSSEAALKYFLTQSIASTNFLFSILLSLLLTKNLLPPSLILILINSTLLMKMGSVPFHFWFPNIMEGLSWFNSFILMSWQKISPMVLLSYCMNFKYLIYIMILNVLVGTIGSFNQASLRKLMAFSSINNVGWMISALMTSETLWSTYFLFYSMFLFVACFMFYISNIFYMNQMFNLNFDFFVKLTVMLNFLSLGGLPPFLGFLPKWLVINQLILDDLYMITFIFIMTSLIMLFVYIRVIYSAFMFYYTKLKWFKLFFKNNLIILIYFLSVISLLGMILSTFFFI
uniref:NADH-ubiquinone oxidoreductase chain 2 n=1 Tax=Telchinia polis TaxID=501958 RepID=A0A140CVE0_9NEOP|nr:NADH dehydrogenase subunit 2 [Telchinia polis]AMJ17264.1 NADH dehydrogenase subunit 2 [Telchinia polis]